MPTPTAAEIDDAIIEYSDYSETKSLDRVRKYITAVRRAIFFRPDEVSRGSQGDKLRFSTETYRAMLLDAKKDETSIERAVANEGGDGFRYFSAARDC